MPNRLCVSLALLAFVVTPSLAKDQCWDRAEGEYPANMFLNMAATDQWRDSMNRADPQVMGAVAGLWYGEIPSPQQGMVDRQYRSFEPSGLFQYRSQTCGIPGMPCAENYGTGEWVARAQGPTEVFVMMHFSDMTQNDRCGSFVARLDGDMMYAQDGSYWQRSR